MEEKGRKKEVKAWSGRFKEETDQFFEDFTESISFDYRLAPYEIKASLAYAEALKNAKILNQEEYKKLKNALIELEKEIKKGKVEFKKEYEDVHMNIEQLLFEKIGEVAYKLHTGRSRNEQVVTDLRLYLMDECKEIKKELIDFMEVLIKLAERNLEVIMPGFTHLQHAQPVLFSHWILGYYEMFRLHLERIFDYEKRLKLCPLGSSAFAGCGFPLDRKKLSESLSFIEPTRNSVFAVSSRDFVLEVIFVLSLIMLDLSRLCEEVVLWMTEEFKFAELSDRFCSGSSIMPQKKNPDSAELIRGKCSTVIGNLFQVMLLLKNLPLSYNRDLQEDKPPLFQALSITKASLKMAAFMLNSLKLNKEKIKKELEKGYLLATELADYLVLKGIPFRNAHKITGKIVLYAEEKGKKLEELTLEEFKKFSNLIENDVYKWLNFEHAIKRREVFGGTAKKSVKIQIKKAKREIKKWKEKIQ